MIRSWILITFLLSPSVSAAQDLCDKLGALEADPHAVAPAVSFQDIDAPKLIEACTVAINRSDDDLPRFLLQRGRGYLRLGSGVAAMADIRKSHDMDYPAATFGLATAYYLGDDVEQDFDRARKLYESSYDQGVRWSAKGLAILYENESYAHYNVEEAQVWAERFEYQIPANISASTLTLDKVLDDHRKECASYWEPDIDFEESVPNIKLLVSSSNFYDIKITAAGKMATIVYANFTCMGSGKLWSGSGGSKYYIIVDDVIFEGWGGKPYSIDNDDLVHVILPRSGGACETSNDTSLSNASICHGLANWDTYLNAFNSLGNQLPIWEN